MSERQQTRRGVLAGVAVPAVTAMAGCGGMLGDAATPTPEPLTELRGRPIYVDESLSLSAPDIVEPVDSPGNAEIVVVPADTDRSNSAIVHWLAADRYVAFVGHGGWDTWHEVKRSDAYAAMLNEPRGMVERCAGSGSGSGGTSSDCDPLDLLVIERLEEISATHGFTWNDTDDPRDRRYFEGLDDVLADDDG